MLSAAELASIRVDAAGSLPDTCAIVGWVRARDARGGDDERLAPDVRQTGVPCLLAPTNVRLQGSESGGQYGPLASKGFTLDSTASVWRLLLPYGTALSEREHIRLETGPRAGDRFEVVSIDDAEGYATLVAAKVVRAGVSNAEAESPPAPAPPPPPPPPPPMLTTRAGLAITNRAGVPITGR